MWKGKAARAELHGTGGKNVGTNIYPVAPLHVHAYDNPIAPVHNSSALERVAKRTGEAATKLCNRMIMCVFAVSLLWATSLQICVAIVGMSIKAPSFSSVYKNCKYAYGVVQEQSDYYAECTERQVAICRDNLDTAYVHETFRVSENQRSNLQYLHDYSNVVGNCSASVVLAKEAIGTWASQGVKYAIPYTGNCSAIQKASLLDDTSAQRTSVYVTADSYASASDGTVTRLATYSVALSSYNAQYLHNKTRALQSLAQNIVDVAAMPHIRSIQMSFEPVYAVFNTLLACTSLSNTTTTTCPYPTSLIKQFNNIMFVVNRDFDLLVSGFQRALWYASIVQDRVTKALSTVNEFYEAVQGAQGVIKYVSGLGFGSICGKTSPNICSFNPAMWTVTFIPMPDIFNFKYLAAASELWQAVRDIPSLEMVKIRAMAVKLQTDLNLMVEDVRVNIAMADFTPRDYNPPSYPYAGGNTTLEIAAQALRSSNFAAEVAGLMSSNNISSATGAASALYHSVNTTAFLSYAESILSQYTTSSSSFDSVDINFSLLLNAFFSVSSVFYLFDYIYRAYQTVHLVSKFWKRGIAALPAVDLRSTKPDLNGKWFVYVSYFLQILPFFTLQLVLLAVVIVFVVWAFAALYVPALQSYSASCVHHSTNTTFLSRNLDSLAYMYAVSDGNSIVSKGLAQYNAKSALYCFDSARSSLSAYTTTVNSFYEYNYTLSSNMQSLSRLQQCVDLPTMDTFFQAACCDQSAYITLNSAGSAGSGGSADSAGSAASTGAISAGGGNSGGYVCNTGASGGSAYNCPMQPITSKPYLPPGYYTSQAFCSADNLLFQDIATGYVGNSMGLIQPSAFNCKALPKCQISCSEPDRAAITLWTKHCSCMVEWYANGSILQTLVALLAYLLVNASRTIVLQGLIIIWWRDLTPQIFEYTANCDSTGRILNNALKDQETGKKRRRDDIEHQDEASEFRAALGEAIAAQIVSYERKGYALVFLGLLVNLPWIVLTLELQNDIAYVP